MSDLTIIVPDIHAGWEHSRVDELVEALQHTLSDQPPTRLIFLGDVFDLWRASEAEALDATTGLRALLQDALDQGIAVEYILGNHDFSLLDHLGPRSSLIAHLPEGIRYHHRYYTFRHTDKPVLVAHGDDCDFLYLALERLDPVVGIDLTANHVYNFYRWMAEVRPERLRHMSKKDLRQIFMNYLLHLPHGDPRTLDIDPRVLEGRRDSFAFPVAPRVLAQVMSMDATRDRTLETVRALGVFSAIWENFVRVDLDDVEHRLSTAFSYTEVKNFHPFNTEVPIADFFDPAHIVIGHFHKPRQSHAWRVTDAGSWVKDPDGNTTGDFWSGSWAEVSDGEVRLMDAVHRTVVGEPVPL